MKLWTSEFQSDASNELRGEREHRIPLALTAKISCLIATKWMNRMRMSGGLIGEKSRVGDFLGELLDN